MKIYKSDAPLTLVMFEDLDKSSSVKNVGANLVLIPERYKYTRTLKLFISRNKEYIIGGKSNIIFYDDTKDGVIVTESDGAVHVKYAPIDKKHLFNMVVNRFYKKNKQTKKKRK